MKFGKKSKAGDGIFDDNIALANDKKQKSKVGLIVIITILLIIWVLILSYNVNSTVSVVMVKDNVYKNQVITEDMLMEYKMIKGEFDKYATVTSQGEKKRRLLTWDERGKIINSFAAYPLKAESYLEYRDCIKSRTDNSDIILYSFPGKNIVSLSVGVQDMQALKTFLKPGDKIKLTAIYKEDESNTDEFGFSSSSEIIRTETVFENLIVADLLNNQGDSILDIYSGYNELSVWEQAQLDSSESFKTSTEPKTLLVALTPEEEDEYYRFESKDDVTFKVSLPQRDN